jgi:hypothetical protein
MLTHNVERTTKLRMLVDQAGQPDERRAGMVRVGLELVARRRIIEQHREPGVPFAERRLVDNLYDCARLPNWPIGRPKTLRSSPPKCNTKGSAVLGVPLPRSD